MIHVIDDFYNKVATEIRTTYFPSENHGTTDNIDYWNTTKTLEDFNNGALNYRKFIGRLSKSCNTTTNKIHQEISKYVVSFGNYNYRPKK